MIAEETAPEAAGPEAGSGLWVTMPLAGGGTAPLLVPRGTDLIANVIIAGQWEPPPAFGLVLGLVDPGDVVLDLGAHLGTFALAAAARGCRVIAVEASRSNASMLEASARAGGVTDRLTVVHAAVGARCGTIRFGPRGPHGQVVSGERRMGTVEVPLRTVDDLLTSLGHDSIALVKVDVEGYELAVLEGMRSLLRGARPIILYESNSHTLRHFGVAPSDLARAVHAHGYDVFFADEDTLELSPFTDFQPETCIDCLAVAGPVEPPGPWRLRPTRHEEDVARVIVNLSRSPNPDARADLALTLADASPTVLGRADVRQVLEALCLDPVEAVARAASWWPRERDAEPHRGREPTTRSAAVAVASHVQRLAELGTALRDRLETITAWR